MADNKELTSGSDDFNCVIEAGKILMESGAEVYRIEETMKYMAASFRIEQFNLYVVHRGIMASGINRNGEREARVISIHETTYNLGKIEAVNSLSRKIVGQATVSAKEIASQLDEIDRMPDSKLWAVLLAYFIGAGCFSYAIGSTIVDSLSSAIIGLILGLVLRLTGKFIKASVLLTIIGSAVVTISANLLCLCGFGQHRGLIILGTFMLLVPGAAFTNSVREFSQNNHTTGLALLMSALLTCLSLSIGVALTIDIFPFSDQMTIVFFNNVTSVWEAVARTVMAGIGTIAFSFLFHAPKKYFPDLGLLGATSWMIYLFLSMKVNMAIVAIFVPALFAALMSRFLSVKRKCPITIFLSTSMFPLLPGLSFYRAVYLLMTGMSELAGSYMRSCFNSAFAIAVSIIIIQQIKIRRKKKSS